jgi:hypothetical protein
VKSPRLAVLLAALVVTLAGCALPATEVASPDDDCSTVAPEGASPAALAYAAATNAATPAWHALSTTLAEQGNMMSREDFRAQIEADKPFVAALQAIEFPPEAAAAGADLIAAVQAYDAFVRKAYETSGYLAAHPDVDDSVNNTRAQSSARLRDLLDLPASTCVFMRP